MQPSTAESATSAGRAGFGSGGGARPATAAGGVGEVVGANVPDRAEGAGPPDKRTREHLLGGIGDAGFAPKERNTRCEIIREYEGPVSLAERRAEPQAVWD